MQPEWVWAARDDGSAAHRLVKDSEPTVSPNGKLVLYDSFARFIARLAVVPTAGGRSRILLANWLDGAAAWCCGRSQPGMTSLTWRSRRTVVD